MSACGKDNNYLKQIVLTGIFDSVKKKGNLVLITSICMA